jgi:hypothetical protein
VKPPKNARNAVTRRFRQNAFARRAVINRDIIVSKTLIAHNVTFHEKTLLGAAARNAFVQTV